MSWRDLSAVLIEWFLQLNWALYAGWLLFGLVLFWIIFGSHKSTQSEVEGAGEGFALALVLIWYGWFVRPKDDQQS
jgi:hypothetical protein